MKKIEKSVLRFIGIVLFIILISFLVYLNLDLLNKLIREFVNEFSYLAILVFSLFADILIQPIGPEVPAILGVLLELNIYLIILFTILGSYIGSIISFYVGKGYLSIHIIANEKNMKKVKIIFKKYGKWGLFIAAISPVPWVAFCLLVGSFKMKLKDFIFYGLIPRFFRISIVIGIIWYTKIFIIGG